MRLAHLHPMLTQSTRAIGYTHQLEIDCPACGPKYRIVINLVLNKPAPGRPGVWGMILPPVPFGDGWNGVTMTPSYQSANHGRKKQCAVHFSIIDGEIVP